MYCAISRLRKFSDCAEHVHVYESFICHDQAHYYVADRKGVVVVVEQTIKCSRMSG